MVPFTVLKRDSLRGDEAKDASMPPFTVVALPDPAMPDNTTLPFTLLTSKSPVTPVTDTVSPFTVHSRTRTSRGTWIVSSVELEKRRRSHHAGPRCHSCSPQVF